MARERVEMGKLWVKGLACAMACCVAGCTAGPSEAQEESREIDTSPGSGTRVVLLGTGTPGAEPDRSGPAVAVVVGDNAYLVDFGPGVVRRAAAAHYYKGVQALAVPNLSKAFVTHLHSDHTAGYPDLILTPWTAGRDKPLHVYGPPGIEKMTDHILKAYEEDILLRVFGAEEAHPEGCKVIAHEVEPGVIYEDTQVRIKAFAVRHGDWPRAFGYRFEAPDRTIVISGDTAPCESLIEHASGCDVLVHEVYSQAQFEQGPPSFQEYHSRFHTSSVQLAEIATKVRPGLLVLYHQLLFGATEQELLEEIRKRYDGKVVFGKDLEIY